MSALSAIMCASLASLHRRWKGAHQEEGKGVSCRGIGMEMGKVGENDQHSLSMYGKLSFKGKKKGNGNLSSEY